MLPKIVQRLWTDTLGGAAALFALGLPVVVGGIGMGTEVGLWYLTQRKLQHAADVAAFAAAGELRNGRGAAAASAATGAATIAATNAGYEAQPETIFVTTPYKDSAVKVEVRLLEKQNRLFSSLFGEGPVVIGARAVAQLEGTNIAPCVLALGNDGGQGNARGALTFSGNANIKFTGCDPHTNSAHEEALVANGNVRIEAGCASAAGGVHDPNRNFTLKCGSAPLRHTTVAPDPFRHLPPPPSENNCKPATSTELTPGRYCQTVDIKRTVKLQPGNYVFENGLKINAGANVTGTDVLIYLKGDRSSFDINGHAKVSLKGRTSDPVYAGVLVFSDPNAAPRQHVLNGTANVSLDGAFYARRDGISVSGNLDDAGVCTRMVAATIEFSGNTDIHVNCSHQPSPEVVALERVRLVE